ncbi:transposase [Streptomyces sp. NPDC053720]|uniref:transposase n=1 Tax=Streptomyces sp. NPDC053720 TaxID=3154855 RepID=UPI00343D9F5E
MRPQGGGTQDTPDETLFAAIVYVLASGCAWRALPPCFGISKCPQAPRRQGLQGLQHT